MANEPPTRVTSNSETLNAANSLFAIGAELIREVQTHVGASKIKSLRLTLAGKHLKDLPVSPATAIASMLLIITAVVISNLRVEIVKDAEAVQGGENVTRGAAAPGGVL